MKKNAMVGWLVEWKLEEKSYIVHIRPGRPLTPNGSRVQRTSWTSTWQCSIYQVASRPVGHPSIHPVGQLSIHPSIYPVGYPFVSVESSSVSSSSSSVHSRYIEAFQNGLTMAFDRVTSSLSSRIHQPTHKLQLIFLSSCTQVFGQIFSDSREYMSVSTSVSGYWTLIILYYWPYLSRVVVDDDDDDDVDDARGTFGLFA